MSKKKMKIPKKALCFVEDHADMHLSQDEDGKEFFSMIAYSGKVVKGFSFWGDLAIDVSGLQFNGKRFPILEQHDLDRKIGVSNARPSIENNQVIFEKVNLLSNSVAQEFKSNLDDGFPYQSSVGITPLIVEEISDNETAEVNGYKMKGPGSIIRKAVLKEASVCVFGADPHTSVASLSDENEEIEVEFIQKNQKMEETGMTLNELQEKYPEIFAQIQKEASDYQAKIQELTDKLTETEKVKSDLEKEKQELSEENTKNAQRIEKLEKSEALRKEKDIQQQADSIIGAKFNEHNIPVRLHEKIKKQINHSSFISENQEFDDAKFTESVDAEIKDWADTLGEFTKNESVLGMSSGGDREDFSDNDEKTADRLLSYVNRDTK